ncbi:MAG: UDP-glucose/GDP-mannose dehydrogenase family protein [Chloroflexota bacterium]|nr:MAG: UDP-glucose/GDP-mannose dehydrogenase family protein [Chloroflexota bacterium]
MKVSVFGLGYVGAVSAACLATDGHEVLGIDVNPQKVRQIQAGKSPIIEPGLSERVAEAVQSGQLKATTHAEAAVLASEVSLICVGTPSNGNSSLDTRYVEKVCAEIGSALAKKRSYHVVVFRSTILPSTVRELLIPILEQHSQCQAGVDFGVCMNPEFLREGSSIRDFYNPSFVIIGELDRRSGDVLEKLYQSVDAPVFRTNIQTAEMVKYVSNAFHALKIAFANEIGALCKTHGIDGQEVMEIFIKDKLLNISPAYLRPGFAFGGSCLPKDLRALAYRAKQSDLELPLVNAVLRSNEIQIQRGIKLVEQTGRKKIGVLGLSFKPGTDDVRESPAIPLVETLIGRGYQVMVYDEIVNTNMLVGSNKIYLERELPHIASIMSPSVEELVKASEVVVITNGSKAFYDIPRLIGPDQTLIDLVGIAKKSHGFAYEGIGW